MSSPGKYLKKSFSSLQKDEKRPMRSLKSVLLDLDLSRYDFNEYLMFDRGIPRRKANYRLQALHP